MPKDRDVNRREYRQLLEEEVSYLGLSPQLAQELTTVAAGIAEQNLPYNKPTAIVCPSGDEVTLTLKTTSYDKDDVWLTVECRPMGCSSLCFRARWSWLLTDDHGYAIAASALGALAEYFRHKESNHG